MMADIIKEWKYSLTSADHVSLVITALLVISVPLLLHFVIYRSSHSTSLPCFLLVGPSGSGKTTLLTFIERGRQAETRESQIPLTVECSLPVNVTTASSRFRSPNDPSHETHKKFLLADTPGHGKLRHHAVDSIINPQNLVGIIFMIDAADISTGSLDAAENEKVRQTAEYLHDLLLLLQRRVSNRKTTQGQRAIPFLIAANKQDLFTAIPAHLVKLALEKEITKIRSSRSKGLLDSGIGMNDMGEERETLGDLSENSFEFSQMEEYHVTVKVAGGNIVGSDVPDTRQWWDWIGEQL